MICAIAALLAWSLHNLLQSATIFHAFAISSAHAIKFDPILSPNVNLSQLGQIAFSGNFDALSQVQYNGQVEGSSLLFNGTQSLQQQLPNGDFITVATVDNSIEAICLLNFSNGTLTGIVVAGNLTSIGTIHAQGVVIIDPSLFKIIPLPGLSGSVSTVFCDQLTRNIYVVGDFVGGNSSNLLLWDENAGWINLPFAGFNGPVAAIVKVSNQTIIFGGTFNGFGRFSPHTSPALNGLFEWSPNSEKNSYEYPVTQIGATLEPQATVTNFAKSNDIIFVGGKFTGPDFHNLFFIQNGQAKTLPGGGVNGEVRSMLMEESENLLFVGGAFNNLAVGGLSGLNNIAVYSVEEDRWDSLGAGVNGVVTNINPLLFNITGLETETIIIVNGLFTQLQAFNGNDAVLTNGIGVWVPSANNWLSNLNISQPAFYGQLTSSAQTPDLGLLVTGSLVSYGLSASSVISFSYDSGSFRFQDLGLHVRENNKKIGITTGLFYAKDGLFITVVGGSFAARGTYGIDIQNLAFINTTYANNTRMHMISGLSSQDHLLLFNDSTVSTLVTIGHMLYASGNFHGSVNGQRVAGILSYDLRKNDYAPIQPPPLTGQDNSSSIITVRPKSNDLYVGGSFSMAGNLDCPCICIFDVSSSTWRRPGSGIEGHADFMTWTAEDTLVVGGSLNISNSSVLLATYFTVDERWTPFSDHVPIPGVITALSPTRDTAQSSLNRSSNAAGFWIGGLNVDTSGYLLKWDGIAWQSVADAFSIGTQIKGMQVFSLAENNTKADNDFLAADEILLVWGDLRIPRIGNVSAAFFNGTDFSPFIVTETFSGKPGLLNAMFTQQQASFARKSTNWYVGFYKTDKRLSVAALPSNGPVIAVAVAVLSALILIIVVGELIELYRRAWVRWKTGYIKASQNPREDE